MGQQYQVSPSGYSVVPAGTPYAGPCHGYFTGSLGPLGRQREELKAHTGEGMGARSRCCA